MTISKTSGPFAIKYNLRHQWNEGKKKLESFQNYLMYSKVFKTEILFYIKEEDTYNLYFDPVFLIICSS